MRFDILSAAPEKTIMASDHVFEHIQKAIETLKQNTRATEAELPFTVGAIGYLSYDVGRTLEQLPSLANKDIEIPDAVIGIYYWSIVVDHESKKSYLSTCYEEHDPSLKNIKRCLSESKPKLTDFQLTSDFTSNLTKEHYRQKFETIKEHIYNGNCYQINLAQRFKASYSGDLWVLYQFLRTQHGAPFSAFIKFDEGNLLSLSPERFLKVNKKSVETKPIKGTAPRFKDPAKDTASAEALLKSEKDFAENLMIVDLLRNDLSKVCKPGTVKVPKLCALESFSNVHHLVSTITGELKEAYTAIDLFKHCFPGGSITGTPKIAAMKIIESLEPHRRSAYCGSIFYADIMGNFDSNLMIRTVIADEEHLYCYGGGAIVYDSNCENEYQETLHKVGKIMQIITNQGPKT